MTLEAAARGAMFRAPLVIVALLVIASAVVRNGAVHADPGISRDGPGRLWSGHPLTLQSRAMAEVGEAARNGEAAGAATMQMLDQLAIKAPLSIEPVLVAAVAAQDRGDLARAEQLFRLAEQRQGRSLPPHFFLADMYLRTGRLSEGLREVVNLVRLSPNGVASGGPYLAQFAQDPENWPALRWTFRDQPELVDPVLAALAQDPANARAILALADASHRGPGAKWLPALLGSMVKSGQYRQARALWAATANIKGASAATIHDPAFTDGNSPPPFNWELAQSPVGLAERRQGSGLHVIFYGSQGGMLTRQMLILEPGNYRMRMRSSGQISDPLGLSWSVRCDQGKAPLAQFPMRTPGSYNWTFTVPAGCAAQWIELNGRAQDMSGRSDLVISGLELTREPSNG